MDPYVHKPGSGTGPNDLTYDLAAVLIHRGPSAYSGHYVGNMRVSAIKYTEFHFNSFYLQRTFETRCLGRGTSSTTRLFRNLKERN